MQPCELIYVVKTVHEALHALLVLAAVGHGLPNLCSLGHEGAGGLHEGVGAVLSVRLALHEVQVLLAQPAEGEAPPGRASSQQRLNAILSLQNLAIAGDHFPAR